MPGPGQLADGLQDASFDPIAYINEPRWHASRLGLDRIIELLDRLGNPQDSLRFVHVAGTNGKGSTCAFLARILEQAGYRTGLFTSPYIIEFSDRIRVNGRNIPYDDLLQSTLEVRRAAEAMEDHPTEFELMTAVAMLHFQKSGCDIVVLEVGLGGRYDSTNVIRTPELCVITPIALDHMGVLGDTVAKIAAEKAGIVKDGVPVISAVQPPDAEAVIREACQRCASDLRFVDAGAIAGVPWDFSYGGFDRLSLGLLGSYQPANAALAVECALALRDRGFSIDDDSIRTGLSQTRWPGRFEIVSRDPAFIVDGGHNPQGAGALADSLRLNFPGRRVVFLIGILADKDYALMLEPLIPFACSFMCIEPPNPRALPAKDLADSLRGLLAAESDVLVECAETVCGGVARAVRLAGPDCVVCACGSLYSIADVMDGLRALGRPCC